MSDRERHPCHHPGCKSDGLFGENVFFKPREGQPEIWWCPEHWKAREKKIAGDPKLNQPRLEL